MNIVHVITRLIVGGAQENTILTCRGLVERGHHVTLIAGPETGPEGSLWEMAGESGCKLVRLDSLRRAPRPLLDIRARREMTRMFRATPPQVVHTHSSKAGILARDAARRAEVPIVIHTIHGMSFNRTQRPLVRMSYELLERRAARHTDMFICVADAMTAQCVNAGIAPADRFVTIRSGMETDRFRPHAEERAASRRSWGVGDGEIVVGTVARLFKNKGYDEIVAAMPRALSSCPRLRFVWVGDGAHRERYINAVARLGFRDRIHLTGLVPPHALPALLNGMDMVVHASRWEGLARVLVQAMLTELPVVSFDNDGAPEVVLANETGILVPYGDTNGLADGIDVLTEDEPLRRRLGRQGRERCLEAFDWRRMTGVIEKLYFQLAESDATTEVAIT